MTKSLAFKIKLISNFKKITLIYFQTVSKGIVVAFNIMYAFIRIAKIQVIQLI